MGMFKLTELEIETIMPREHMLNEYHVEVRATVRVV